VLGMPDSQRAQGETRHETPLERLDRNLEELTGELRVVVTGVQVLFAFLLIVPFDTGFAHVGNFERTVYFVTLVLAALAAVCTIAPSAEHRVLFRGRLGIGRADLRNGRKEQSGLRRRGTLALLARKLRYGATAKPWVLAASPPLAIARPGVGGLCHRTPTRGTNPPVSAGNFGYLGGGGDRSASLQTMRNTCKLVLFATIRTAGRSAGATAENRGVGGSSPPLAIAGSGLPSASHGARRAAWPGA